MAGHASGFGVYNDPAIAIAWLLGQGAERIAYVDIDAHHGDGVQAAFYADPRVLTISLHEHPATLFPFTGLPTETGGPGAEDRGQRRAARGDRGCRLAARLPRCSPAAAAAVPATDPGQPARLRQPPARSLANLELSIDAQRAAHAALHVLAHDLARGRWLLTGGGGYELVQVVPRTWTHLIAEAAGQPINPETPTPPRGVSTSRTELAWPHPNR